MRKPLRRAGLAAALTAVVVAAPAVAYAAAGDGAALERRAAAVKDALAGLVSDGTLTQQQADEVATALAEARADRPRDGRGPGSRGPGRPPHGAAHLVEALAPLGLTAQELKAAAEAGQTLAQLAQANDVTEQAVVDALVAAMEERLADAVAKGRLTQEQADARLAEAPARIAERLDEPLRREGRRGPAGPRHRPSAHS